jgi:hypothetical protein
MQQQRSSKVVSYLRLREWKAFVIVVSASQERASGAVHGSVNVPVVQVPFLLVCSDLPLPFDRIDSCEIVVIKFLNPSSFSILST